MVNVCDNRYISDIHPLIINFIHRMEPVLCAFFEAQRYAKTTVGARD